MPESLQNPAVLMRKPVVLVAGTLLHVGDRGGWVWMAANILLGAAVAVVGLWAVRSFASQGRGLEEPDSRAVLAPAAPHQQRRPELAGYRKHITGRALFVAPAAPPPGQDLEDAIAKAKARVQLRAIARVRGRMGAYFEIQDGAEPAGTYRGPPSARPDATRRPARNAARSGRIGLYHEGDRVGDFTVVRVEPRVVVLRIAGHEVTFSL